MQGLIAKITSGVFFGIVSISAFLLLRAVSIRFFPIMKSALDWNHFANFIPVFLEGVAVAFIFARIKWAFNLWTALTVPSFQFALAHVPSQMNAEVS